MRNKIAYAWGKWAWIAQERAASCLPRALHSRACPFCRGYERWARQEGLRP